METLLVAIPVVPLNSSADHDPAAFGVNLYLLAPTIDRLRDLPVTRRQFCNVITIHLQFAAYRRSVDFKFGSRRKLQPDIP